MNPTNFQPPTYFENIVSYDNKSYFKGIDKNIEWRGQIKSLSGNIKFRIKFYGELMTETFKGHKISDTGLIVGTDFSQTLVIAEEIETKDKILLFDGCRHGYDAMFCDEYTDEQLKNRPTETIYKDEEGNEIFEIIVKVYYGIDYDEEIEDFKNENGEIELISGEIISEEKLKRNGFDYLEIRVINSKEKEIEIISEELA
ncbi:hypothetical protein ACE939_04270 [Aquimarina sp. W85]|uniref:hypothetical protein n=1 Tax=Aquimarina rhodophyticola TaxID=3342246 RepID=UPI0036719FA9